VKLSVSWLTKFYVLSFIVRDGYAIKPFATRSRMNRLKYYVVLAMLNDIAFISSIRSVISTPHSTLYRRNFLQLLFLNPDGLFY
jgi:hypothetical protein